MSQLPNARNAVILDEKMSQYLLNLKHPDGGSKAVFFINMGFHKGNLTEFRKALHQIAIENDVTSIIENAYGIKYIVEGFLKTKRDFEPFIRTVWIIENNQKTPFLITAYPI